MDSKKIIELVAKKNGISYEECYAEMMGAVREGFHSDDPEAAKAWEPAKLRGKEPTVEDFIRGVVQKITGRKTSAH